MTRAIFIAITLLLAITPAHAARAIDGDTVEINGEIIRLLNIDTPEIGHAKCPSERKRGQAAKLRMQELLRIGTIKITRGDGQRKLDRYGRTLARLAVGGVDLGEIMVREGHARKWDGKRHPWC